MATSMVEKRSGGYYVARSRVSLASIVYEYRNGSSIRAIVENFPVLSIEQVTGAIEFYEANRVEVETYLRDLAGKWKESEAYATPDPVLQGRIEEARKRLLAKPA